MRISDFDLYQELLIKESGLSLTPDKSYLLDSRLLPVAKKWGYNNLDAMTVVLRGVPEPAMVKDVVEAMTTNETYFFRDGKPFEIFKNTVAPYLATARTGRPTLKIWCAACSSGQEPYSLAMTLLEHKDLLPGWKIEILATDISDDILDKARQGEYTQFEAQRGLPVQMLLKYFEQSGDNWKVKDELKRMITFKNFNLLGSMAGLGTFDLIMCRNVLIYFDEDTKGSVLNNLADRLTPDGFLFLGGAETVLGITDAFKPMPDARGLYVLSTGSHDTATLAQAASQ